MSSVYSFTEREQQLSGWRKSVWCQMVVVLALLISGTALADDTMKIVTEVCAACHNMDGNSNEPAADSPLIVPKLAGRNPDYLVRELKAFMSGKRKSEFMAPIVAKLDSGDLRGLAEYFGAQKPNYGQVMDPKAAKIGEVLFQNGDEARGVPACAGCHNVDGSGNSRFPRLAGQHRKYLITQLNNFKNDIRSYESARLMQEVSKRLTDDEIVAVADYLNGLH